MRAWIALVVVVCGLLAAVPGLAAERRIALVIGNSAYRSTDMLANPRRDAEAIAKTLAQADFEVTLLTDLDQRGLQIAMRDFGLKAEGSDVALAALAFVFAIQYEDLGKLNFVRSFFGVHKIMDVEDGQFRILQHGTTEHGAQRIRDEQGRPMTGRPDVLTYYHSQSPMARGIVAAREKKGGPIDCYASAKAKLDEGGFAVAADNHLSSFPEDF